MNADREAAGLARAVCAGSIRAALTLFFVSAAATAAATGADQANTPAPEAPAESVQAKPASAARKFEITEFDVSGNSVLTQREIERAVLPYLGPDRTMEDIDGARAALEKAYAARGFQTVNVVIPPQTVRGGVVLLNAVETRIGHVTIKGESYSTPRQIRSGVPTLTEGAVPDLHELNKELVQLNSKRSDLQVTPQMSPGEKPQTIDVSLDVADRTPLHGGLELNNRYSRDTHPLRLQANLSYDDLWRAGHSLSFLYSVAPQKREDGEVYAVTYAAPIPDSNVKLSLTGLKSNSNVTTLGSTDVLGKGQSATFNASISLGTVGSYFHYLQTGFAYKHFTNTVTSGGQSTPAPITYFPFSITYAGTYRGRANQISFSTGLNFAFRNLGSESRSYDFTRYRADGDFAYLKTSLSWLHNLPHGLDLYAQIDGQVANEPLVSNEQFAIGGDGTVRGYLQSEGLGDDGARASLELRSPSLVPHWASSLDDLRVLIFAETAYASLRNALPEQQANYSLSSVGFGFNLRAMRDFYASASLADPLRATAGSAQGGVTKKGHPRFDFRLYTQF